MAEEQNNNNNEQQSTPYIDSDTIMTRKAQSHNKKEAMAAADARAIGMKGPVGQEMNTEGGDRCLEGSYDDRDASWLKQSSERQGDTSFNESSQAAEAEEGVSLIHSADSQDNLDTHSELLSDFDSKRSSILEDMETSLLRSKDETKKSTDNIYALTDDEFGPSSAGESEPDQMLLFGVDSQDSEESNDVMSVPHIGTNSTMHSLLSPIMEVSNTSKDETENVASMPPQSSTTSDYWSEQIPAVANLEPTEDEQSDLKASVSSDTLMSLPEIGTNTTFDSKGEQQYSWEEKAAGKGNAREQIIMRGKRTDTPPLMANKSNDTLMSLPEIGTSTTVDTVTSPDELDEDETDTREAAAAAPTRSQESNATTTENPTTTTTTSKYEYFIPEKASGTALSDDRTGGDTEALSIPEIGTDTTYSTDGDDSTNSKPLLQNLSEEALFFYKSDNVRVTSRPSDNNNVEEGYRKDSIMLEQIMPRQPEIMDASEAKFEQEEEKIEVHEEYATTIDGSHHSKPEERKASLGPVPVVEETQLEAPAVKNTRPEYVSATVLKVQAENEHGLEFVSCYGTLRVSSISSTGLFWDSPLKPFDRILRINNLNCETLDPVNASHLLDVLTGFVIVIAQNIGGDSSLIESQITKPHPDSDVGITFRDICRDEVLGKNEVEIARMGDKSLFTGSLLHVGDRVLSVNQSVDNDSHLIDIMLRSSPRYVTMLAQTKLKTKMAIARRPTHQLPPGYNFVRATAEARRQHAELQRKQGCYYNMCERPGACANFFQWVGNVYVITIVIVGVVISWETVKEQTYDGSDTVGTILKFMGLFVGGILLGFLVNAPWWFRKVGARFSIAQLVCNAIVIASFFILTRFFDSADLVQDYRLVIFFAIFFPLLIIVNLPTIFVKREDGSDGNTISDRSPDQDDLSSNSSMTSDNV